MKELKAGITAFPKIVAKLNVLQDELKQLESQRVKELKAGIAAFPKIVAKLNALQDELEQLESRRAKKIKVKVEKREHSPRLNEVIDLT